MLNKKELPFISVVIPHRASEDISKTLELVKAMDYPSERMEYFAVSGNQPSAQRNACIKKAKGDIIYFIDNDSEVRKGNLKLAAELFQSDDKIGIVGGPNLAKEGDSGLQKDFSFCLTSGFGTGPVSVRYKSTGEPREATDRDLILCNMLVKKELFNEIGMFNEELYPNEENDLMERAVKAGYKMFYHPEIAVERSPRPNIKSFIKMLLNYGRGRFEQFLFMPSIGNLIFFAPAAFVFYLISLPICGAAFSVLYSAAEGADAALIARIGMIYTVPLLLYLLLLCAASISALFSLKGRFYRAFYSIPFIYFLIHFFYGLGIYYGALKKFILKGNKEVHFEVREL